MLPYYLYLPRDRLFDILSSETPIARNKASRNSDRREYIIPLEIAAHPYSRNYRDSRPDLMLLNLMALLSETTSPTILFAI